MDPLTATFIGAGATLLGSLNKRTAETDLEAARLLDQEDPIRRTLEAFPIDKPVDARIVFINGSQAHLVRVIEIGFGAARLELQIIKPETLRGTVSFTLEPNVAAVVRFSSISMVHVKAQR